MQNPRVVVIGNSYSSAAVYNYIYKYFNKSRKLFDLVLIAENSFYYFKNLLPQLLCDDLELNDISERFRKIAFLRPGISFLQASVINIDFEKNAITTSKGEVNYDYLVLAPENDEGKTNIITQSNYLFNFKTLEDVINLKEHIFNVLELASNEFNPEIKQSFLTFCVFGSCNFGIEVACSLNDFIHNVIKIEFPNLNKSRVKVNLILQNKTVSGEKIPYFRNHVLYVLNKKGIKVALNTMPESLDLNLLKLTNGSEIRSSTVISAVKDVYSSLMQSLSLEKNTNGQVPVNLYSNPVNKENVFVIGESIQWSHNNNDISRSMMSYKKEAYICARNIISKLNNDKLTPMNIFKGFSLLSSGYKDSILSYKHYCIGGLIAWILHRMQFIVCLIGFKRRLNAFINFVLNLFGIKENNTFDFTTYIQKKKRLLHISYQPDSVGSQRAGLGKQDHN